MRLKSILPAAVLGVVLVTGLASCGPTDYSSVTVLAEPTPANLGELSWRIGFAIAAVNFLLISLALATGNPRSARTGNLVLALFAFVIYYNLINLGQSWIASGRMQFGSYVVLLHGGVLALTLLALSIRHHHFNLWTWLRRGRAEVSA